MTMHNPPHAGEIISDIMEDLDIGIRELARALAVAPSTASRMVSGLTAITPEMAIKLSVVIGSTPAMWLRIQAAYDLDRAEKTVDLSVLNTSYKPAPLKGAN
ncbi:HigA family addiction module antitoxin [Pantoea phytobeneficialis]|uniref:Addiction module antidote protein, HigA family n=1 Tax=Pantoea phytobeneficialis TaxID=2052056 RepID=A0AAP9HAU1_9GAMM|nr:HigA family addiction module antitoxin [Pantoea phytobeneficialis]MDO6406637.1 HigA family addiction module antitoxin [Pantoea phytobeneficialis]QGR09727.1 addiction module antidote protein, HigA family [Pantoea phytobeneficialis]